MSDNEQEHQEQLAMLGLLTSGVAHELRTPLAFVQSNLGSLASYLQDLRPNSDIEQLALLDEAQEMLTESLEGLRRMNDIIHSVSTYNRQQAPFEPLPANAALQTALQLTWHHLKYQVEVRQFLDAQQPIHAVHGKLSQVFVNLIMNALQAMQTVPLKQLYLESYDKDQRVYFLIADNGVGIADDIKAKIFDLFFTTKGNEGTGLGLALTLQIVHEHQGDIALVDHELGGAAFRISFPAAGSGDHDERHL